MNIIEVIKYIAANPGTDSVHISADLNITPLDARNRLNKLKKSGQVRVIDKTYPYKYEITDFGKQYIEYSKTLSYKTKQWHGMIPKSHRGFQKAKIFKNLSQYIIEIYDSDQRLCGTLNVDIIEGV